MKASVSDGTSSFAGGVRGMLSILESGDPDDAQLLHFGRESSNLVDRERNLIFFASPAQLLIVEDDR